MIPQNRRSCLVYDFDAEIKLLEGKMKWNVVYFPESANEAFGTKGRVQIDLTVDSHEFDHTLLPSKNGHYFVYNKIISQTVGKKKGDTVRITVKKMEGKRDVKLPDYVRAKLSEANTLDAFVGQPDYIKREQIYHIETAKKDETKEARIKKLVSQLRDK